MWETERERERDNKWKRKTNREGQKKRESKKWELMCTFLSATNRSTTQQQIHLLNINILSLSLTYTLARTYTHTYRRKHTSYTSYISYKMKLMFAVLLLLQDQRINHLYGVLRAQTLTPACKQYAHTLACPVTTTTHCWRHYLYISYYILFKHFGQNKRSKQRKK